MQIVLDVELEPNLPYQFLPDAEHVKKSGCST